MAQIVFTSPVVTLNSTVITSSVQTAKINWNPDMLDNTVMGMTGKCRKKGLDDWSIELELLDDFASAALDEGLWTLFNAGTTTPVIIKPSTAVRGPSNPEYTGVGIIEGYSVGGPHGELAKKSIRIIAAGASIARTTTAT